MSSTLFPGQRYLKVLTPKTENGVQLLLGEDNRLQYREDHLPYSALKHLEKENETLPTALRHKIEVIQADGAGETKVKNKGGRPRKEVAVDEQDVDEKDLL